MTTRLQFFYSNTVVAESALDRLSCGLGGKTMMPHVEQNIPGMLSNPDWRYRYGTKDKYMCITLTQSSDILLCVLQLNKPLWYCLEIIFL
jgi:hypothetical protein